MDICGYEFGERLKIVVKASAQKTNISGFDREKNALKVDVHAPAEKGKANAEIVKHFSKLTKKKVKIVSGLKSKTKVLRFS